MSMVRSVIRAGLFAGCIILILTGCRGGGPQSAAQPEGAGYPVVDSLLASFSYRVPGTGVTMRSPLGFEQAHDSILLMLQHRQAQEGSAANGVRMVACFLDTLHTAGVMISVIDNPAASSDTAVFFSRYRQSLENLFGAGRVREEQFLRDSIFRKVFTISEENLTRVQCLAYTPSGHPLELTFFMDKIHAELLRPRIESSIAGLVFSRTVVPTE